MPIELRTRGNVRRNPRLCSFAPLRLELPKDKIKGTVFEGHGNVKVGVHCQGERIYEQYMLKEFLANRLHNLLTPRSLRVRLARITYADKDPSKEPYTKMGILYEDADDMAKRVEARELPVPRQMFQYLDQPSLLFMSLFQYMIGNTDYSILVLHNVIMLDDVKGARIPVPYDFDYSGLVNAHYAAPTKGLGHRVGAGPPLPGSLQDRGGGERGAEALPGEAGRDAGAGGVDGTPRPGRGPAKEHREVPERVLRDSSGTRTSSREPS